MSIELAKISNVNSYHKLEALIIGSKMNRCWDSRTWVHQALIWSLILTFKENVQRQIDQEIIKKILILI